MTRRCVDCKHLTSAEHIAKGFAKLGLGKCAVTVMAPATFLTAASARECAKFEQGDPEVVAKRVAYIGTTP